MFDVNAVRRQFPALERDAIFFDGPAGSQTPTRVLDAIRHYMVHMNANHGGLFATSRASDALLHAAHAAVADLLGADDPNLIAFGANMTSLTFALSRSLARTWKPGDEVLITRLDHDANITPWVLAARDAGATVKHVAIRCEDGTLDLDDFRQQLSSKTCLVAVGCASNALGTLNPVKQLAEWTHAAGGHIFLDAVHHAPHASIDVAAWDCDFLACSAYKFFGPHVGILYGKRHLLESLPAYKLRPAPDDLPGRWMTGTQSHEGIAGTLAAVDYLADLGRTLQPGVATRRAALLAAYEGIVAYERGLAGQVLRGFAELKSVRVHGLADGNRLEQRVPTFAITHAKLSPRALVEHLDRHGIYAWHGNFYALAVTEALGLEPEGMVRLGLLHYNTADEVRRLLTVLAAVD